MPAEFFLDSAYAIALAAPGDDLHEKSIELSKTLRKNKSRLVTTRGVLLEIGNSLSKPKYRAAAIRLLEAIEADPLIEIVDLSPELYRESLRLFRERPDKNWGLTDCIAFVVMAQRGISEALTSDEHFAQAGFKAVLKT